MVFRCHSVQFPFPSGWPVGTEVQPDQRVNVGNEGLVTAARFLRNGNGTGRLKRHGNGELRALRVSLLEPIFEKDTMETRFFAKMKDENVIAKPEAEFLVNFEKGSPMPR